MPIEDENEAAQLAEELAREMVDSLDADMVKEAKAMGMATSVFAGQIEEYRARFNKQVSAELAAKELFDVAASRLLIES
jgi:hypothetical protein